MGIVGLASSLGVGLFMYNLVRANFLFCLYYFIAVVLGVSYIIIEMNTIFSTYTAVDKNMLYMKNWDNGFLPYDIHYKMAFIREFVPAKTEVLQIPVKDVSEVLIGSRNFVKRYCHENAQFMERITELEKNAFLGKKNSVRNMDLFYIKTKNDECCFMPVTGFDETDIIRLLNYLEKRSGAFIKCNNKSIRRKRAMLMTKR
jgi:hypothetical protein